MEFQFPYEYDCKEIKKALDEVDLPVMGINTIKGDVEKGDNGLLAIPSRVSEAREALLQAFELANYIKSITGSEVYFSNYHPLKFKY